MVDADKTGTSGRRPDENGPARPSLPPTAPKRISHYRLRRVIATGGMGTVYEAQQDQPRRAVAVKVLTRGVSSPSALRRFRQESQILGRLRHPGIAQVYEAGMYEDPAAPGAPAPFFALEYIPNARTLTAYAQSRRLGTRQKLELFRQVCDAVHYGHVQGVIHRDLKPANILVDSAGRVKVIDFGVARTTDSDLAVTTQQTMDGQLVGTLQYMAPEQIEGDVHAIDARCDVYALGVVLYELLSERMPYDVVGKPFYEITRVIREIAPTPASSVDTAFRGDVDTILKTALQKNPDRRYATVQALQQDIERYLRGRPIEARRDHAGYVAWTLTRRVIARHPLVCTILAAVAAVLIAGYAGIPLVYQLTGANEWVERSILTSFGTPAAVSRLDRVRVVVLTPEADVEALAAEEGLEDVTWTPRTLRSLRRLHGRMMERLANAGPDVVVWDMQFPGDATDDVDPHTADFITGIRVLKKHGIPVVVGVASWDPTEMTPSVIHPAIAREVQYGGLGAHMSDQAPWILNIIVQKDIDEPMPSLVLAALAASELPKADEITYSIDEEDGQVTATGWHRDPLRPARRRQSGPSVRVELSGVSEWDRTRDLGIDRGDIVGRSLLQMPSDETLAAATISYADVMRASDTQLRQWFENRAAVLWAGPADLEASPHPDGRTLSRFHGQAVGLDMLLGARTLRLPRPDDILWILSAMAAIGALVAFATDPRWVRRVTALLVLTALSYVASVLTYRFVHYMLDPIVPVIAMIVAAELSAGVLRIRAARRY